MKTWVSCFREVQARPDSPARIRGERAKFGRVSDSAGPGDRVPRFSGNHLVQDQLAVQDAAGLVDGVAGGLEQRDGLGLRQVSLSAKDMG